jgi:hypothetical protein
MIKLKSMALNEQTNPEYNSRVWNGLGDKDRYDALASVNDDDGPDYADEYMYENDWSKIPNEITRHIDLTRYKDKMIPLNHVAKLTGAKQVVAFMGEMKKIGKRNKVTKRRGNSRLPKNVRVEQEHPGIFCTIKQDTDWYWQAKGNYGMAGRETLEDYHIYAYDRYHTQIKEIVNKIQSYYDSKNDSAGDIGTVSESKKIKLKDLLTEQGPTNGKGMSQDVWDASPGHSNKEYDPRHLNVSMKVKSVSIDFKYTHQSAYYDDELDSEFIEQLYGDIEQQIEDSKVFGTETNNLIDIDRVVSNMNLDCEAIFERPGQTNIEIDFSFKLDASSDTDWDAGTFSMSEDYNIIDFQVEDDLPEELGITEEEFGDMVNDRVNGF